MAILQKAAETLSKLREKKPLVHHLTNYVTANDCANITLAVGASPVMADDPGEAEEMVSYASALVINIGTINSRYIESMIATGKKAVALGIPVIFDPVGAGATSLRTNTARRIIQEVRPTVIRGNISEIKVLAGLNEGIKGVDSTAGEHDSESIAASLSQKLGCVIAVTGKTDIIARENDICRIHNGHVMLTGVTGTGCMVTSLTGCCCGAVDDPFIGAITGIAVMGIAGELSRQSLKADEGIGTFRIRLFDYIANMTPDMMMGYAKFS